MGARSLIDIYANLEATDGELAKEAEEFTKVAAEEYAAGAITARGFMDECEKIAELESVRAKTNLSPTLTPPPAIPQSGPIMTAGKTIGKATQPAPRKAPSAPALGGYTPSGPPTAPPPVAAAPAASPRIASRGTRAMR